MIRILIAAAALLAAHPAWSQERVSQERVSQERVSQERVSQERVSQERLPQEHSRAHLDALIIKHAAANGVPESLVRRVVVRESKYNARAVGRGGTMGLMQIKHATARGVGYTGSAAGLLDPDTNLTYAVRYLAGAYRAAGGNESRAVSYYAGGYYHHAKRMGLTGKTYAGKTYAAASAVSEPVVVPDVAAAAPVAAAPILATPAAVPVKVGTPMVLVVAAPKTAPVAKSKAKSAKAPKAVPAAVAEAPVEAPEVDVAEAGADQPISAVSPSDRDFPH